MSDYRRRPGDRKDGRLLRTLPAFSKFIPYIMPQRNDRFVHYEEAFEVSRADRRLRQLRLDGYKGIGLLGARNGWQHHSHATGAGDGLGVRRGKERRPGRGP